MISAYPVAFVTLYWYSTSDEIQMRSHLNRISLSPLPNPTPRTYGIRLFPVTAGITIINNPIAYSHFEE